MTSFIQTNDVIQQNRGHLTLKKFFEESNGVNHATIALPVKID